MLLRGKIKIVCFEFKDDGTQNIKWIHEQSNLIPDSTLVAVLGTTPVNIFANQRISISTSTDVPDRAISTVDDIIATGYVPVGVTSPVWVDGEPDFGRIQNRIDQTGTSRTFQTLALTGLAANNSYGSPQSTTARAYVLLTVPCTQGATDILDLFYRIEFLTSGGDNINALGIEDFGKALFNLGSFPINYLFASPFSAYASTAYESYCQRTTGFNDSVINPGAVGTEFQWDSVTTVPDHFKTKYAKTFTTTQHVGKIFNTMFVGFGTNNVPYGRERFLFIDTLPIQNNFGKGAASTLPFLDTLNPKTGSGTCNMSGTWTGQWPEMYEFQITGTGAVGAGTYKWRKRPFLGFQGNTFTDNIVSCPFRNPSVIPNTGFHGWESAWNDVLSLSDTEIIQYDADGVTYINLITGEHASWDTTTTPALTGATTIRQCAVDKTNRLIYVGCRVGGLYEIDIDGNSITRHVSIGCYGVDVGASGKAFAIVDAGSGTGRLTSSDDWNATLTFSFTGISDNNWTRVQFLKVDPTNADRRLAIVYSNAGATQYNICWWNEASTVATAGPTQCDRYPASLDVSDNSSFWACLRPSGTCSLLTYGSASFGVSLGTVPRASITHPVYGSVTIGKVAFYTVETTDYLINTSQLTNSAGTLFTSYTALIASGTFLIHVGGGVALASNGAMRILVSTNSATALWQSYGWNGSAWELNNANSRTIHSSAESLGSAGNGLSIAFTNGGTAPEFFATDFYLQGVCTGILKDNLRDATYVTHWYSVPAQFEETVSTTIPASAPYELYLPDSPGGSSPDALWIRAESDTLGTIRLRIDGTSATIKTSLAPAPGEILIDGETGLLTFNSVDAGKALTGSYNYVKYGI